jgi:cellulose synthase operon protein C
MFCHPANCMRPCMRPRPRFSRVTALCAAAVLALGSTPGQAQSSGKAAPLTAQQATDAAALRVQARDLPGALTLLRTAIKADRNATTATYLLLAQVQAGLGDAIAADAALDEARRLGADRAGLVLLQARAVLAQGKPQVLLDDPRFADAGLPPATRRALLLLKLAAAGDLQDGRNSQRLLQAARELDANAVDTWVAEVPVRLRAQQLPQALAAADKAVALATQPAATPTNTTPQQAANAHTARASVALAQGDTAAALASFGRALAAVPNHTDALISRASLLLDIGKPADLASDLASDITTLRQALPKDPRVLLLIALAADQAGKPAETKAALQAITQLVDRVPMDFLRYRPQVLVAAGLAYMGLGTPAKAKPYLEQAQRLQPGSAVSKVLAQIYFAERKPDRALESLDSYLKAHPNDLPALHLLAAAHMSLGRHARAAVLLQEALRRQDDPSLKRANTRADTQAETPALRGLLAASQVGVGSVGAAVTELEAASRAAPGNTGLGAALTTLYLHTGQASKAVRLASQLTKAAPNQAGLQHLLGLARGRAADAAGARAAFEAALALDPSFMAPQLALAKLDTEAGAGDANPNNAAYTAAAARLTTLVGRWPTDRDVLFENGRLADRRGDAKAAATWLAKADDASPSGDLNAALALVDLALRQPLGASSTQASTTTVAQTALAKDALKRLSTKAPTGLPTLIAEARVQLASFDAGTAKLTLTRATGLASYEPGALVHIALLQLQAGQVQGAVYALQKALSEKPGFVSAIALMIDAELRLGDLPQAEQRARQLVAAQPGLPLAHALLGDVALARQQAPAAVVAYRKAHQLQPTSASLLRLVRAQAVGDNAGANRLAEQWLQSHPADTQVRRVLADNQARGGNYAGAKLQLETLLKTRPQDAEALNNLAHVLLLLKDPQALSVADQALAYSNSVPYILGTAGWANLQAGKTDGAMQLLRMARLRDPANPDTRYFLGAAMAKLGQTKEARDELDGAIALGGQGGPFVHAKDAAQLRQSLK